MYQPFYNTDFDGGNEYLPVSGEVHSACSWRLVPVPSNLVMANDPRLDPAVLMVELVSPMMVTGTLMVKPRSHSHVWAPRTSELAAMSCPKSQTLKATFRGSSFGTRIFRSSNLKKKIRKISKKFVKRLETEGREMTLILKAVLCISIFIIIIVTMTGQQPRTWPGQFEKWEC